METSGFTYWVHFLKCWLKLCVLLNFRVAVLNGGFPQWQAKGFKIDKSKRNEEEAKISAKAAENPSSSTSYKANLKVTILQVYCMEGFSTQDTKLSWKLEILDFHQWSFLFERLKWGWKLGLSYICKFPLCQWYQGFRLEKAWLQFHNSVTKAFFLTSYKDDRLILGCRVPGFNGLPNLFKREMFVRNP